MDIMTKNHADVKALNVKPAAQARRPGDYRALSHRWDQVMVRGQKMVVRLTTITGPDNRPERMACVLVRRMDQHGSDWYAAHFLSCDKPGKCRRVAVDALGKAWLLLDDDGKAVSTRNKYALYAGRLMREMASRKVGATSTGEAI